MNLPTIQINGREHEPQLRTDPKVTCPMLEHDLVAVILAMSEEQRKRVLESVLSAAEVKS